MEDGVQEAGQDLGQPAAAEAPRTRRRGRAVTGRGAAHGRAGFGRGRGRGRKRAREPSPPPLEQEAEEQQQGWQGESDGSEEGGSDGEGAAAQQQQPAHPPLPPPLSAREQARQLLTTTTGVSRERADEALAEVAERRAADGGGEYSDAEGWADAAQIALAERAEFEAERDELRAAMERSLREAEAVKKARKPPEQQSAEELQQEFAGSELLGCLLERCPLASLLEPPVRQPLIRYLELEKRCKKWWCIARFYLAHVAAELAAQLAQDEGRSCCGRTRGCTAAAQAGGAAAAAAAGAGAGAGAGQQGGCASSLALLDGERAAVLAVALDLQREEVEAAAYQMPSDGGSKVEVPALFADAVPEGAAAEEVVELDSSDGEDAGGGAAGERQQQQQQQAPGGQQQQQQAPGGQQQQQQQAQQEAGA